MRFIHRRGHGHDDEVGLGQHARVVGIDGVLGRLHLFVGQLTRRVGAALAGLDLVLGDVKADGADLLAKFDNQRQTDVAQPDDGECLHDGVPVRK